MFPEDVMPARPFLEIAPPPFDDPAVPGDVGAHANRCGAEVGVRRSSGSPGPSSRSAW
jgi:hypothetical protein